MYLEEEVEHLKRRVDELAAEVEKCRRVESWATVQELAKIMQTSPENIYRRINAGKITADKSTGNWRIPLSQFQKETKPAVPDRMLSAKEKIFGKEFLRENIQKGG